MTKKITTTFFFLFAFCSGYAQFSAEMPQVIDGGAGSGKIKLYPATTAIVLARGATQQTEINSAVESINTESSFTAEVFPNPATNNLYLLLQASAKGTVHVAIRDIAGRKIFESDLDANGNFKNQLSVSGYQSGTYLISFAFISSTGVKNAPISRLIQIVNSK